MGYAGKITNETKILLVLSKKHCCSIEELEQYTKIKKEELKVYLSKLAKEGKISRGWGHIVGKKFRKYCIKTKILEELNLM
jgi:predicted transcriptional regulator of viral defense system